MSSNPRDFIPRPDANFDAWSANLWTSLSTWWADQGFDPSEIKDVQITVEAWHEAYAAHVAAQAAAEAARQTKDAARRAAEAAIRPVVARVQVMPMVTNATRAQFGISLRESTRTPAATPSTAPSAIITSGGRLTHRLRLVDPATPTRRSKPKGVARAEVFVVLTAPNEPAPSNIDLYKYVGGISDGTTTLSFPPADGGKQAHYITRWVNTTGEQGPWSEATSATVAA
jgi:hypothetical protein